MDIMSLDSLAHEVGGKIPPILGIGGIMMKPEGFVMMNVQIPCVKGYNEDQIAIVMDDPGLKDCPVYQEFYNRREIILGVYFC